MCCKITLIYAITIHFSIACKRKSVSIQITHNCRQAQPIKFMPSKKTTSGLQPLLQKSITTYKCMNTGAICMARADNIKVMPRKSPTSPFRHETLDPSDKQNHVQDIFSSVSRNYDNTKPIISNNLRAYFHCKKASSGLTKTGYLVI